MNRVYDDACDKNVAAVIIYKDENSYYYDEAHTKEVPAADMLNLYFKGLIVKDGTTYKTVLSCTEAGVINVGL